MFRPIFFLLFLAGRGERRGPCCKKKNPFWKKKVESVEVGKKERTADSDEGRIEKKNVKFLSPRKATAFYHRLSSKKTRASCSRSSPLRVLCARRRRLRAATPGGPPTLFQTATTNFASQCVRNPRRARSTLSPPSRAGSACWPTLGEWMLGMSDSEKRMRDSERA